MDFSKLPKLSQTPVPPSADGDPKPGQDLPTIDTSAGFCTHCGAPLVHGMRFCGHCAAPLSGAPATTPPQAPSLASRALEAWLSIALGIILMLITPNTLLYASSRIFHTRFTPYIDPDTNAPVDYVTYINGARVPYRQLLNYWSDLAITAFAFVLLLDGMVLILFRNRLLILTAFVFTILATLGNLAYIIHSLQHGLPIISALAVAFGVYIAVCQWATLNEIRAARRPSPSTPA